MSRANLYDWTDVLAYGSEHLGYNWNTLHAIMVRAEFPPMYEAKTREYYLSDFQSDDYGFGPDLCGVCIHFMKDEEIDNMVIT